MLGGRHRARAYQALKDLRRREQERAEAGEAAEAGRAAAFQLLIGSRFTLTPACGRARTMAVCRRCPAVLLATDRAGFGNLCELITLGRRRVARAATGCTRRI